MLAALAVVVAQVPVSAPGSVVAEAGLRWLAALAHLPQSLELVVRALLPVVLVVPVELPLAAADSVAVLLHLLSRQSFSAAMARSTT